MRRALPWLLVSLLLALSATSGADGEGPAGERVREDPYPEELRRRVDQAVDRGVTYLLGKQRPDGSWEAAGTLSENRLGVGALCVLACLKGGVPGRDPAVERALGYLRTLRIERTYDAGVLLMALHARHTRGKDDVGTERDRYGFDASAAEEPCTKSMTPEDRAWMQRAVDFLLARRDGGHWGYPERAGQTRSDLSNTQYALLGLWAASRCGIKVPAETWLEILAAVLADQERTGPATKLLANSVQGEYRVAWTEDARARGFRYRPDPGQTVTGSMTTAGLACVAICQDELWTSRRFTPELRTRVRKGIRDGLAWLQDHFDVTKNPGLAGGGWHLYYLYGLERAGILARSRFVGRFDWYLEGATWLLARQEGNGSWSVEHPLLDTAFAVLFLRRSTQRARNPAITPSTPGPSDGGKR